MVSTRIGKKKLSSTEAATLLKQIQNLEGKINEKSTSNLSTNLEMNQVAPPKNHSILYFLVCSCADIELNALKKQLRAQSRDRKRLKSGKSVYALNSAAVDLQKLTSTLHWHHSTHKNPIPDGILSFISSFHQFKIFTNETLRGFESGEFPDATVLKNLNKGAGVYFPWSIQNLNSFLATIGIENSDQELEFLLKKLIGKTFSITRVLSQKSLGHLNDPHAVYIQLQALMISSRLVA